MKRAQVAIVGVIAVGLAYAAYRGVRSVTDGANGMRDAFSGALGAGAAAVGEPIGRGAFGAVQWARDLLGVRTELGERIAQQEADLADMQRAQRAAAVGAVRLPQSTGMRTYQAPAGTLPGVRKPWGT